MLASTSLAKESVEGIISAANSFVGRHLSVGLDTVLKTVELPAGISNLDASLSNVDRDTLTLEKFEYSTDKVIHIQKQTCTTL